MKNFEERLLERYYIDVQSKRKIRGGFICNTEQGILQLSKVTGSAKKLPYINYINNALEESGERFVDTILPDKEGELTNSDRDQGEFVLKKWFMGRECDIRKNSELFAAVRELAMLHCRLRQVSSKVLLMQSDLEYDTRWDDFISQDLVTEYDRHNVQLNKVRNYIRKKANKGKFDFLYLEHFDDVYGQAVHVTDELRSSQYIPMYKNGVEEMQIVHGDFNYHNVLFVGSSVTISNISKFKIDVQVADLYNFLRKVLEKRGWDVYLGADLISAYEEVRMLSDAECEYIRLRLSYPEKYWKITNSYYNSNKAWVSDQIVGKLEKSIAQMCIKKEFVEKLFNK